MLLSGCFLTFLLFLHLMHAISMTTAVTTATTITTGMMMVATVPTITIEMTMVATVVTVAIISSTECVALMCGCVEAVAVEWTVEVCSSGNVVDASGVIGLIEVGASIVTINFN